MRLDYNAKTDAFILYVPRGEADPQLLMKEFGLAFSQPASTEAEACLFTYEPYIAASFADCATERAQHALLEITTAIEASWASDSLRHIAVPPGKELWPFQRASCDYILGRPHALDADQPGLGKTPTAIAVNNEIQARHTLVVCPASIRHQWRERILEWDIDTLRQQDIAVIVSSRRGVPSPLPKWTIISWELVHSQGLWRALAKAHFDHLILDEAHYAKRIDTKRARAVFGGGDNPIAEPLIKISEKVTALTGTPLPKRPQEAYVLARHLCFSGDTNVLTDRGAIPMSHIQVSDRVWDGFGWVKHSGVVYRGDQITTRIDGIRATPDHQILSGQRWRQFSELENESIHSLALATGLDSLKCLAIAGFEEGQLSWSNVLAAQVLTKLAKSIYENLQDAPIVEIKRWVRTQFQNPSTLDWFPIQKRVVELSIKCAEQFQGATALSVANTLVMADEAFLSLLNGSQIEWSSSGILSAYRDGMIRLWNLIVKTILKGTNPEMCASLLDKLILQTDVNKPLSDYDGGLRNLKPVYDIVNAGPRHRFTILTDSGALVVSNCFDSIEYMSQDDFNEKYNPIDSGMFSRVDGTIGFWKDEATYHESELQNRMRANYMVRHMKRGPRGVMNQLNYPLFDLIHVTETIAVKQALEHEALLEIDWQNMTGLNAVALGHIAAARQEMGLAIAPQAAEYIAMLLDGGEEKLVVFAWHTAVLDILCHELESHGVIRVDGSDGAKRKYVKVQEFINDPTKQIIIGNVLSLGTGTDGLQKVSSHGLMVEADWTHGNNTQAFDRLDRGGQKHQVQADIFVAPGSISEKVLASAIRDGVITHKALDRTVNDVIGP